MLEKGDIEGATELNLRMWVDGPLRVAQDVNATVRQQVYEMQFQAFKIEEPEEAELVKLDPPASERLSEIVAPTLAIFGELDWPERFNIVSLLAGAMPNAQALTLAGGAHMVSMEQPGEFNRLLLEFWRSLEQAGE
ncbi:hypothetical protein KSX_21070 [Ktedonospora formicarum]|uniref:Alpha/beta hydrolase n=1 Tax=Ktedonospora formicarum TaxID=2778364 RepID=A0A8J3I306_9CHLR|nr:hypothetical protein KSX_21070 [Ktedonospora formicarum]